MKQRLCYFCIYNPSLGTTDDTVAEQIVFFISPQGGKYGEDVDDKLRRVGLAQGMVEFARGFARGQTLSHVDSKNTRMVICEV